MLLFFYPSTSTFPDSGCLMTYADGIAPGISICGININAWWNIAFNASDMNNTGLYCPNLSTKKPSFFYSIKNQFFRNYARFHSYKKKFCLTRTLVIVKVSYLPETNFFNIYTLNSIFLYCFYSFHCTLIKYRLLIFKFQKRI